MCFFKNLIIGFFIGAGAILPGVSSGVLCVILGIYEKLLNSILQFFSNLKENLKFLVPIFIGAFLGMVLFGNILIYLFNTYPLQIQSIFIGLILGSIPSLLKQVNNNSKENSFNIIFLIISALIRNFFSYYRKPHTKLYSKFF